MNTSASKRITDMTQGNVLSLILRFGLPLIAANTCLLYTSYTVPASFKID